MANHVDSVAALTAPRVSKAEFYRQINGGDLVFCSGHYSISKQIEACTHSPWSHVLMAWMPSWATQWLTLEATKDRGVHVGVLADYVDTYNGDILLTRRGCLAGSDVLKQLNAGFSLLDYGYDWQQEVTIVAHKLCKLLPIIAQGHVTYCSGLQYVLSLASGPALQKPGAWAPTPEENFTDPSVSAVCVLDRSA